MFVPPVAWHPMTWRAMFVSRGTWHPTTRRAMFVSAGTWHPMTWRAMFVSRVTWYPMTWRAMFVSRVTWYPMTWRAIFARAYLEPDARAQEPHRRHHQVLLAPRRQVQHLLHHVGGSSRTSTRTEIGSRLTLSVRSHTDARRRRRRLGRRYNVGRVLVLSTPPATLLRST